MNGVVLSLPELEDISSSSACLVQTFLTAFPTLNTSKNARLDSEKKGQFKQFIKWKGIYSLPKLHSFCLNNNYIVTTFE